LTYTSYKYSNPQIIYIMRKSFKVFLGLLLFLGISLTLSAQSNEAELDQKELTKQFIGKWVTDWEEGTVTIWEVNPVGNGYDVSINWKNEGQLSSTDKGVIGFTSDGLVAMVYVWSSDGLVTCDYGKFVSKNEISVERYDSLHGNVTSIFDFEFISTKKMKMVWKRWGPEESPEDAEVIEFTWTKVNQ
jgi:hypothetical protein